MSEATRARCVARLLLAVALLAGCEAAAPRRRSIQLEAADTSAFAGNPGGRSNRVFDLVAADMDADGDEDLLINWHHLAPLELFENLGGRFRLVNPLTEDRSGLYDNRAVPTVFAPSPRMERHIGESDLVGLVVWHDMDRRGSWRFAWRPGPAARLDIETSLTIDGLLGLEASQIVASTQRSLGIELTADRPRSFSLATEQVTIGLTLALATTTGEPLTIYLGRDLVPRTEGSAELWKPDPHGIAWADVEGDPRPEIYITRGALIGQLKPPRRAKRERYYLPAEGSFYEMAADSVVPRDRSRGRRVEWVDVDNDGSLELSVAAESTPNRLLTRPAGSAHFTDLAADYGLDLPAGAVLSWADHDGDGREDVYVLASDRIDLLINRGPATFEVVPGTGIGLALPNSWEPTETQFDFSAIRMADFDGDGDLDLWLLSSGRGRTNHLFRREADGFTDVSAEAGLDQLRGNIFAVLCDFDNDGYEDVLSSGRLESEAGQDLATEAGFGVLWHNQRGREFRFERLSRSVIPEPIHAATCIDADADGLTDVAAAGPRRLLLRNRTATTGGWVDIVPTAGGRGAVGALVRLRYSNGQVVGRRYGSASNSAFSQSLTPLRFGVPGGAHIENVAIRWPGLTLERVYPAPELGGRAVIERHKGDGAAATQPPT